MCARKGERTSSPRVETDVDLSTPLKRYRVTGPGWSLGTVVAEVPTLGPQSYKISRDPLRLHVGPNADRWAFVGKGYSVTVIDGREGG